ncbi:amidohydrolase family protein [Sphingobium fuliginis]|uniref:amidohydrolase family protein n=1 Tax=Sphingobium fuliginis (strain ATCC 27551) TaxID=336203 RepID=UPI00277D1009|nr:amidohydrolase family protein [Sphingobium fuliginis]
MTALTPDGPIHIHIAEQRAEVEACLAWSNQRPVEWLMNHAEVDQRWCLIHATHIADSERNAIAKSAAGVGLCPITEANLGDGLFPARAFLAQGGRIGIGSDSNIRIDAAAELCLLEYGQRLTHQARNLLTAPGQSTGASLYHHARKGAQALGHPPRHPHAAPAPTSSPSAPASPPPPPAPATACSTAGSSPAPRSIASGAPASGALPQASTTPAPP